LYVFGLFVPTPLIRGYPGAEVVPLLYCGRFHNFVEKL
jgi:hypothetical protein